MASKPLLTFILQMMYEEFTSTEQHFICILVCMNQATAEDDAERLRAQWEADLLYVIHMGVS